MVSTTERGYDGKHQAERARWQTRIDAGEEVWCTRCQRQPLITGREWDLGHNDDRTAWTGPEHVRCNRAAGGREAHRTDGFTTRSW